MDRYNPKESYSEKFDELRKNRVEVGHFKYGSAKKNFTQGYVQIIPTLELCLEKYKATGNTEYLCDVANYAMFEYMYPQHPKGHFRATDSSESAGVVGMSTGEIERFREQNV